MIGYAGSDDKVTWLKKLGFDHAFNYKKINQSESLQQAAPGGVDVYFDGVSVFVFYLAHAYNAYAQCNFFTIFVLPSVQRGRGGSGHVHYLAYEREVCNRYSNCLLV